jgi:hypothetical protein
MQPEERDPAYLWDMLEAAREVQRFVAVVRFEEPNLGQPQGLPLLYNWWWIYETDI